MADFGISTLGIKLYAAESTDGNKVTEGANYTQLTRINSIGEVALSPENINASALEDHDTKYVPGRSEVTDSFDVTVNMTDETATEWSAILGKRMCFMIVVPGLTKAFFVIATVPSKIPQPAIDQNGLLTFTMGNTVNNFIGFDEKVEVTDAAAASVEEDEL